MKVFCIVASTSIFLLAGCKTMGSLQRDIDACNLRYTECAENLADLKVDLDAGQDTLDWALKRMNTYKEIAQKLRGVYEVGELRIVIREGRMVVLLPNEVMFESGKVGLSAQGKESLAAMADVFRGLPKRRFVVAGHTDNVPVKKKVSGHESNWELSVARALRVAKFLIKEGISPKQLSVAGHGEFLPIADNDTPDGRKQNRRIEIVLMPRLIEMPEMPSRI